MHAGRIDRNTAAGRVYRVLREARGDWVSSWDLTLRGQTSAVGTRVSEINSQLTGGERIECRQDGRRFWYRWVPAPGVQLELVV